MAIRRTVRRVQLWGKGAGYAQVEEGATRGATLGVDLFLPDGTLLTVEGLEGLIAAPAPAAPAAPGGVIRTPSVTVWGLIQQIPQNIIEAAALTGNGFIVRQVDGNWLVRSFTGAPGHIDVTNPDGEAGDPVLALAALADAGGGALLKFTRDAYGRVSGTTPASLVDLGHALVREAFVDLSALRAVAATTLDSAFYPDITVANQADRVFGITTTAGLATEDVVVQTSGPITDASWSWNPGIVWCGANGVLTQTLPTAGADYWILPVARAVNAQTIIVDIGTPIHRLA